MGRNTVPVITLPMPAVSHPPTEVVSSCLLKIAYHEPLNYLYCQFKSSGYWYIYPTVPKSEYDHLIELAHTGGSVGSYFTRFIKPKYPAVDINNVDA